MASTIQIRVEDELKSKSDALFKDLGTDTTTAIRKTGRIKTICTDDRERDACKIEKVQRTGDVQGCR